MSPAEAGAIELEEPAWPERFEEHCLRWSEWPRYLAEDNAFEATLRDWRRFHSIGEGDRPPAADGVIALAQLKIFPPRFLIKEVPHSAETGYQHDDHMWISIAGEQHRITAIEDRILLLERRFDNEPTIVQIDLNKTKWNNYIKAAVAMLEGMRERDAQ